MSDVKQLRQERTQIFHDVFDNKIPRRVPINISLTVNVVAEYAGIDGKEALWHPGVLEKPRISFAESFPPTFVLLECKFYCPQNTRP